MNKLAYDNNKETDSIFKEKTKVGIADISGRGQNLIFESNWNDSAKKKGYIKIKIGQIEAVVSREQLWSILFLLGTAKEHDRLVAPFLKQTQVDKFTKLIGVTTTKDVKRGETINIPLEFTYNPESGKMVIGKGSLGSLRKEKLST